MRLPKLKIKKSKGFTILEIITVTVIVGVLATLALPRFQKAIEKSKSVEGIEILDAVLHAQKVYAHEHAGSYATDLDDLDIEFDTIKYFQQPSVYNPADPSTDPIADINRNGCTSSLELFEDGTIGCNGGAFCSLWGF